MAFIVFKVFKIQDIECKSQYGPCSAALSQALSQNKNKPYFEAKKNITETLKDNKEITQSSVRLILPNKFLVEVIESKPAVAFLYQEKFYLVDKQGIVSAIEQKNNLPTVKIENFNPNFSLNQKASDEIIFATELMNKVYLVYNVEEAMMTENKFEFTLPTGKTIIFPLIGDIDVLFGSLQVILSRLNSEANYSIIDLRYKNPVLK